MVLHEISTNAMTSGSGNLPRAISDGQSLRCGGSVCLGALVTRCQSRSRHEGEVQRSRRAEMVHMRGKTREVGVRKSRIDTYLSKGSALRAVSSIHISGNRSPDCGVIAPTTECLNSINGGEDGNEGLDLHLERLCFRNE